MVLGFNLHDGGFGDELVLPGAELIAVATGDLNGDGRNDLAVLAVDAGIIVRYGQ